jgi:hypothetical protein
MAYLHSMENLICNTMPVAEANICVVGADLTVREFPVEVRSAGRRVAFLLMLLVRNE